MKPFILAITLIGTTLSANADTLSEFLWIDCNPTEVRFEVRPMGALEEVQELDDRLVELSLHEVGTDDQVDDPASHWVSVAKCILPQPKGPLEFTIWQTSNAAADYPGSGAGFAITANDIVLEEGQLGDTRVRPVDSVIFDGQDISVCPSIVPNYPQRISNSPFGLVCKRMGNDGMSKLTSKSE